MNHATPSIGPISWISEYCAHGHVESSNPDLIPKARSAVFGEVFKPDARYAQRWNNDNQPHQETWPSP
jgi:hypothetical protein